MISDPVLFQPHWEELNVHCPSIDLEMDKFPQVDILNISHRHQDHFDVRTLAHLARNTKILAPDVVVLAPQDEILLDVLKELEFKNVRVVSDFETMEIKGLTLTPTPSLNEQDYFPEQMPRQSFYLPAERGFEREIGKRMAYWNKLRGSFSGSGQEEPKE